MAGIARALEICPELSNWLEPDLEVRPLGGLTNKNYLVFGPNQKLVLRIPGQGTESYINRRDERQAAIITSELGVNAPLIYFDAKTGVQLCGYLENSITMNALEFRDFAAIGRAATSLRRVHESAKMFVNRFELFSMVDNYLVLLKDKNAILPPGFDVLQSNAQRVRHALAKNPLPLTPCHCDPLAENFLDAGKQMYIVDWEYSGNNDPMWDLGDLSVEAGFDDEQDEHLINEYFRGDARDFDRGRMVMYKAMCDMLWTLWGVIQHVNENTADDFWAYATNRGQRCANLMETKEFEKHLQAVINGPSGGSMFGLPSRHLDQDSLI